MQASGFSCGLNMDRGLSVYDLSFKPGAEGTELKRLTLPCITESNSFSLLISKYWDNLQHSDFPGIHVKARVYLCCHKWTLAISVGLL